MTLQGFFNRLCCIQMLLEGLQQPNLLRGTALDSPLGQAVLVTMNLMLAAHDMEDGEDELYELEQSRDYQFHYPDEIIDPEDIPVEVRARPFSVEQFRL